MSDGLQKQALGLKPRQRESEVQVALELTGRQAVRLGVERSHVPPGTQYQILEVARSQSLWGALSGVK